MENKDPLSCIEQGQFEEAEGYLLERMEAGQAEVDEFFQAARALGRQKEKDRARLLLGLFAEHLLEKEAWSQRFKVLKEIARHTQTQQELEEVRHQIAETLRHLYPESTSQSRILNHYNIESAHPEELRVALDKIEWWLKHDVGQCFFQQGYGVGRVMEINLNLGLVRLDFESRKDVAVQMGDQELMPLPAGHVLRQKLDEPEKVQREAQDHPGSMLGRLLREMGQSLNVSQIKECFAGILMPDQWNRWWAAARKDPHIVVSGKGIQATYSWSETTSTAETALRLAFAGANLSARIETAKQHASRSADLASYFSAELIENARQVFQEKRSGLALELIELFSRWKGHESDLPYTFEDVLRQKEPLAVLADLDNSNLKLKVLQSLQTLFPDRWVSLFVETFLREDNPRIHGFLSETLQQASPNDLENLLDQIFQRPFAYPGAFTWIAQQGSAEGLDVASNPVGRRMDGRFLVSVITAIDEPEFSSHRNKLKKAVEGGLLLNVMRKSIDPEMAQKAVDVLEHSKAIEDYRRQRWKGTIRMSFPEIKKKEDVIFSTKEGFDRKRAELEQIIKVELPKNRKLIGEAAAMGDLRENFEYKSARERQEYLINRVDHLQRDLNRVRVLDPGQMDCSEVRPGVRVVLTHPPDKRVTVTILGPWDSNPKEGIYSYEAPLAAGLLGKVAGEKVQWEEQTWEIESIAPWM